MVISFPILTLPNSTNYTKLDMDTCHVPIGCALLQRQSKESKTQIRYRSRFLTDTEWKDDTTHKECLAIVRSVLHLRLYLKGTRFTISADHDPLKRKFDFSDRTGRLPSLLRRLSKFELDIVHRTRIKHPALYAVSQPYVSNEDTAPSDDAVPFLAIGAQDENCSHISDINTKSDDIFQPHAQPDASMIMPVTERKFVVRKSWDIYCKVASLQVGRSSTEFFLHDRRLLIRKSIVVDAFQIVVLETLRDRILYFIHFPPLVGHPDQHKMYDTLRGSDCLSHMESDAYATIAKCESCVEIAN